MNKFNSIIKYRSDDVPTKFWSLFPRERINRVLIGVIPILSSRPAREIQRAAREFDVLAEHCHAVLIENQGWGMMQDGGCENRVVGVLTPIVDALAGQRRVPVGVGTYPIDPNRAFIIADSASAQFVRLDYVTGRFRNQSRLDVATIQNLRSTHARIAVFGGVNPDRYISQEEVVFGVAAPRAKSITDAVVISGNNLAEPALQAAIRSARQAVGVHPILVEDGVDEHNARGRLSMADGVIVNQYIRGPGDRINAPLLIKLAERMARMSF